MIQLAAVGSYSFFMKEDGRWFLREGARGGQNAIPMQPFPFIIGRSLDCHLVLPHSEALARATSRWHCHFLEEKGGLVLVDGSHEIVPESGRRKNSISGTQVNGKDASMPTPVKAGDRVQIGPWEFRLENFRPRAVNIDGMLSRIATGEEGRPTGSASSDAAFGELQDLYVQINDTYDSTECLTATLGFALEKIRAARVAAVLVFAPDGAASTRIAWEKGVGRVAEFKFSAGLVKSLPAERAFLLKTTIVGGTQSQVAAEISSGLLVPLRGAQGRLGLLYMDNRSTGDSFTEKDLSVANALAGVIALQLAFERQAFLTHVEHNMLQYFGPDVARLIVEEARKGRPLSLGVRECQATILFVDMQGFTASCRQRTPQQVADLLNPYFAMASERIQRHGGHVDKFIGDGVLGVFGAQPVVNARAGGANHAVQAVRAAKELIVDWSRRSASAADSLPLRAGINSGRVVVGNIGGGGRIEYSVLGDTVNLASRMEHAAKPNSIALTQWTRDLLSAEFPLTDGGEIPVKGFGPLKIWRIVV